MDTYTQASAKRKIFHQPPTPLLNGQTTGIRHLLSVDTKKPANQIQCVMVCTEDSHWQT